MKPISAYKVYDNENKLVDIFGSQQLCDYATEQICKYKDTVYNKNSIVNLTPVDEAKDMDKLRKVIRKVIGNSEYVANVEQCKLVLRVRKYRVKEVELY